jgi:hypothetical protein
MRRFVILAIIAVLTPVTVGAEPLYAVYTLLPNHPACSGPGHIAYRASFDVSISEAGYFRSENEASGCFVTVRKGGTLIEVPIQCNEGTGQQISTDKGWIGFCGLTEELRPAEISLKGSLTGCLTVTGHTFIDGDWTATTVRPDGTQTLTGRYDDPRLEATYTASSTGAQKWMEPSLGLWLRLDDEAVPSLPGVAVEVAAAAIGLGALRLVDGSKQGCSKNPASCWKLPEATTDTKVRKPEKEIWAVCEPDGSGLKFGINRDALEEPGN